MGSGLDGNVRQYSSLCGILDETEKHFCCVGELWIARAGAVRCLEALPAALSVGGLDRLQHYRTADGEVQ